jgi:hypothetical protein
MSQEQEDKIKQAIVTVLEPHFFVYPEVRGTYLVDGSSLRIDYILKAKPDEILRGLTDQPIGLEVKAPEPDGDIGKAVQVVHQAIDYANTKFEGFGRPIFVLVYPDISTHLDRTMEGYRHALRILDTLMQKAHCGSLRTYLNHGEKRIDMRFAGSNIYWRNTEGLKGFKAIAERRWAGSHGSSKKAVS